MRPPTPSLVTSLPSMLLKPLQLSIVALSIALSYFSATYPTSVPPPQFSFAFVIPLLWILPIYFLVTFISPILLCCQSTYGRRPTWLSPKERYFTLFLPAFATLGWAVYRLITITDNGGFDDYQQRDFGGYQWNVLPSLCLALSTLVFIETYITYRLDMRPSLHQQAPSATCGKLFCLHKCVTTMALKTPSGTPPIDSTYCSSVRLIRNVSAVATIVGTVVLLNIIGLMVLVDEYSSYWFSRWYGIAGHVIFVLLWLGAIFGFVRPLASFRTHIGNPFSLSITTSISVLLGLLLLSWTLLNVVMSLERSCLGGFCTFCVGYAIWGTLFSVLSVVLEILVSVSIRRRYNTTRDVNSLADLQKYERQSQQPRGSPDVVIELVNRSDNIPQELPLTDGKIEA